MSDRPDDTAAASAASRRNGAPRHEASLFFCFRAAGGDWRASGAALGRNPASARVKFLEVMRDYFVSEGARP